MNTPALASSGLSARRCASTTHFFRAVSFPRLLACLTVLTLATAGSSTLRAQVVYDEAVLGDFSNSGLAPTGITVHAGSNLIFGTTGRTTATDRDYFTFTVPVGLTFDAVTELAGTEAGGVSFFGIQAGPQVTLPPNTMTADGLLGWTHYGPSAVALDLFPLMEIPAAGSSGFSGPLGAGTYSIWIQDFTPGTFNYGFDLHLASPVPEPSTYAAAGGALLIALVVRRRFGKSASSVALLPTQTV